MATPTTLPASFTAGQILTASQQNALRGAFRVLQVVEGTTTTEVINSTSTPADTGLTATITPGFTSSKILVFVNHPGCFKQTGNVGTAIQIQLLRGATKICDVAEYLGYQNASTAIGLGVSTSILDSPATTSATTYKTQFNNLANAASVYVNHDSVRSSIILMEVSA